MFRSLISIIVTLFISAASLPVHAHSLENGGSEEVHNYKPEQSVEDVSNELILPVGGVRVIEPVEDLSGARADMAPELGIAAELPAFYKYGSDYGRNYLMNNKPESYVQCYDDLNEQCKAFEGNYNTISESIIEDEYIYYLPRVKGRSYLYNMSLEQICEVVITLIKDHPEYYWLDEFAYSYTNENGPYTIMLTIENDYAEGDVRKILDGQIQSNFDKYISSAEKYKAQGKYMTAKKVHDDIAAAVEYGYEYFYEGEDLYKRASQSAAAHNIVAVLDDDDETMPVCEGYAEAYSMILNAIRIENLFVTGYGITGTDENDTPIGEPHAWNMVKLDDDKFYWVDVTWDDQKNGIIYDFFARGNSINNGFISRHLQNTPDDVGYDFQYELPYVPEDDFEVMPIINKDLIYNMSVIHSGNFGGGFKWTIYENHVLYISGKGDMPRFDFDSTKQISKAPWCEFQSDISIVIIDDGVTSVSDQAFWKCRGIAYAYFPDGVKALGGYVFGNCWSIKAVRFPASLRSIGSTLVFSNNSKQFTDIYYGGTEDGWKNVSKSDANIPADIVLHYNYTAPPEKERCVKLAAEYDDYGRLISVLIDTTFTESAGAPVLTGKKKVFIWNSLEGMRPVGEIE